MSKKSTVQAGPLIGVVSAEQILNHPTLSLLASDHLERPRRVTSFMARGNLSKARTAVETVEAYLNERALHLSERHMKQAEKLMVTAEQHLARAEKLSASYTVRPPEGLVVRLYDETNNCVEAAARLRRFITPPMKGK